MNPGDQTILICELKQGRELANQLKNQLDPITSRETCEALLQKIVSTYDNALSVLDLDCKPPAFKKIKKDHHRHPNGFLFHSSSSLSTHSSKDQQDYKKRKTGPKWSEQVRVCSESGGTGLESPLLVDGHSWRKYGQKDILGAKFPRAYYRCTHRNTQGCLATKQVQRTDEDSSIIEVTYKGRHSCIQSSSSNSSVPKIVKEIPKPVLEDQPKPKKQYKDGLKVETEELMNITTTSREEIFPFYSFPYTPTTESENLETQFFSVSDPLEENDLMGCYSSPLSSDSNYCKIDDLIICSIMEKSESELTDATATPTSVTNSPFGDLEIFFNPDFSLDTFGFS